MEVAENRTFEYRLKLIEQHVVQTGKSRDSIIQTLQNPVNDERPKNWFGHHEFVEELRKSSIQFCRRALAFFIVNTEIANAYSGVTVVKPTVSGAIGILY